MQQLTTFIEKQQRLDRVARYVSAKFNAALDKAPQKTRLLDALHGVWLGHPLHPVLVSLPIGAWSLAAVLDLLALPTGRPSRAATPAIAIGLLGAAATAPAGLADWNDLSDRQRRVGLAHAALNIGAVLSYKASLLFRLVGIGPARLTGFVGLAFVTASGYLGGHLVYRLQAGVAQRPSAEPPEASPVSLMTLDLAEGTMVRIEAKEFPIVLAKSGGRVYALADICTHLACSLAEGRLEGDRVVCTCHGSTFALADGRVLRGPATAPVQAFDVASDGQTLTIRPQDEA